MVQKLLLALLAKYAPKAGEWLFSKLSDQLEPQPDTQRSMTLPYKAVEHIRAQSKAGAENHRVPAPPSSKPQPDSPLEEDWRDEPTDPGTPISLRLKR